MTDKLIIFDTTLRDGEQSPGASMTKDEKLRIARQLERLKVDVIEAGFAGQLQRRFRGGAGDRQRDQGLDHLLAVARQRPRHLARRRGAQGRARARIHTFIATVAAAHGEEAAHDARPGVRAGAGCRCASRATWRRRRVPPEDGYRSDMDFLCRVLEAVIDEGATTINVPDTVGYAVPELYGNFIKTLRERIPNSDKAIWSVHCHNDLGMAVANSLAGVKIGGARQVECTINGLGERAGNCSLEEIVMAVKTRKDYFGLDVEHRHAAHRGGQPHGQPDHRLRGAAEQGGGRRQRLRACLAASTRTACSRRATPTRSCAPRTWAGAPTRSCWASCPAATPSSSACRSWACSMESEADINAAFARFKELADRKSEIFDEDILALVSDESVTHDDEQYGFVSLSQHSETGERPHARGRVHGRRQGSHAASPTATARSMRR